MQPMAPTSPTQSPYAAQSGGGAIPGMPGGGQGGGAMDPSMFQPGAAAGGQGAAGGLNAGPGQDLFNQAGGGAAGRSGGVPGAAPGEPSEAEIQQMLAQIMGGAGGGQPGQAGGQGQPGIPGMPGAQPGQAGGPGGLPGAGGAPGAPQSQMVQQGGMVLETGGQPAGGSLFSTLLNPKNLLNPKFLIGAAVVGIGAFFGIRKLIGSKAVQGVTTDPRTLLETFKENLPKLTEDINDLLARRGELGEEGMHGRLDELRTKTLDEVSAFRTPLAEHEAGNRRPDTAKRFQDAIEGLFKHRDAAELPQKPITDAERATNNYHRMITTERVPKAAAGETGETAANATEGAAADATKGKPAGNAQAGSGDKAAGTDTAADKAGKPAAGSTTTSTANGGTRPSRRRSGAQGAKATPPQNGTGDKAS